MASHHIGWNRSEDSFSTFTHRDEFRRDPAPERPSLLELTREQYQSLLQKARKRSRHYD